MKNFKLAQIVLAAGILALSMSAYAATPTTTLIDGVLLSAGGSPAADGSYDVVFSVYEASSGGAAAWTETGKITTVGGRFTHALGSVEPIDADKLVGLTKQYLGIKVGSDPELPRQMLHATVFTLVAAKALTVACDGCIGSNQITNGSVAAAKVGFNFAASATKGGAAIDLACTGCVSVAEMKFDGDVDLAGNSLKAKNGTFSGDLVAATVTATSFAGSFTCSLAPT